jgi:hypothetical protein
VIVLFLLPRLPPNVGGAVDAGGRDEGVQGGVAARGRWGGCGKSGDEIWADVYCERPQLPK